MRGPSVATMFAGSPIQKIDAVNDFLMQKTDEKFQFEQEIDLLRALFND